MQKSWVATWALPVAAQVGVALAVGGTALSDTPEILLFASTLVATICVLTSATMVRRAFRTNEAELACLGVFFYAVSVFALAHGLTTPDVLFGANGAHSLTLLAGVPVGLVAVAPFLVRGVDSRSWLRRNWRGWTATSTAVATFASLGLLLGPDAVPAVSLGNPVAILVAVASVLGCVALAHRHLELARIARRRTPLVVSAGFGLTAASSLVWLASAPYDAAYWTAHVAAFVGVLVGTVGASQVYRRSDTMDAVVGPVLQCEPLSALAVGLDPVVHQFVADLDAKDRSTRDHVIRTTELAIRVGQELRLPAEQLRDLGLAAILHDVGKVGVPDEILNKTGRLTADEFATMRGHAVLGEQMVASSPVLASIAPAVRGHHERMDGAGYPDGLVGTEICQAARIVAVCDAYDAMANSRLYRAGMGHDKAVSILREHSGSQWDAVAVEALVMTLARRPMVEELHVQIDKIGRDLGLDLPAVHESHLGCDCLPESAVEALSDTHS